jgi:hypothetical protein
MLLYWIIEKIDQKRGAVRVLLVEDEPDWPRRCVGPGRRGVRRRSRTQRNRHIGRRGYRRFRRGARHHVARPLLRRGASERPTVLTAGSLSLDPARRRVTRGPMALNLTPRELRCAGVSSPPQRRCGHQVGNPCGRCGIRTMRTTTTSPRSTSGIAAQRRRPIRCGRHRNGARRRLPAPHRRC